MAVGKDYTNFLIEYYDVIKDFIAKVSTEMFEYMDKNSDSKYVLFYKYITHSDLATFGKSTHPNTLSKNLLYYIDENEMRDIEEKTGRVFQTAHQSCIGLKEKLYDLVKLPRPRDVDKYLINDYMNVYLVNSNLKYYTSEYTQKIFDKLHKNIDSRAKKSWDFENLNIKLSDGEFTEIPLHVAVHGLGTSEDIEFHQLRHHIFKGDTFILLFEIKPDKTNMFILLEKNPIFFNLIGEVNQTYVEYQKLLRNRLVNNALSKQNAINDINEYEYEDEVTRQQQSTWRNMLANEMMGYTQTDGQVFCPITYITADFNNLGTLFRASHIKGFKDPNTTVEEKFDINNGLLLSVQADALFDKHYITINKDKCLEFSFLLDGDTRLKSQLLLMQPIFAPILNEKRMEYLAYHHKIFEQKEIERRKA